MSTTYTIRALDPVELSALETAASDRLRLLVSMRDRAVDDGNTVLEATLHDLIEPLTSAFTALKSAV